MRCGALRRDVGTFATLGFIALLTLAFPVTAAEVQRGGTLTVSVPGEVRLLDPPITGNGEEWLVTSFLYSNLTRIDTDLNVQPDAATDWESNADGTVWTFYLHEGVMFHHGREMTAEDVAFSIRRILDPDTGSRGSGEIGPITEVEEVDRYTVRFYLDTAIADFPANLALPYARIIPEEKVGELNTAAYGTGPFELRQFTVGDRAVLVRNEDYFRDGLPYLDRIVVQTYPDSFAELNALRSGTTDIMWQTRVEQVSTLEQSRGIVVSEVSTGAFTPVVMRSDRPPFDDPLLRKALKLTLDREQVVNAIVGGHGVVGNDQSLPPSNPAYHDTGAPERDIERAKELLAEAGYPDGIELDLYTTDAREGMLELALILREMAKEAGFDISITQLPWDVFLNTVWEHESFYVNNWFARPTTSTSIFPYFVSRENGGSLNDYFYSNPEVDRLLSESRGELDPEKRADLYAQAQELVSSEGPAIIPYFKNHISAYRDEVHGYEAHPLMYMPIEKVWIED